MAENIADKYQSHTQESHIYDLPDTYIGSAEEDTVSTLVLSDDSTSMSVQEIKIVPGLYKVFDEVLVNALDQYTRLMAEKEYPLKQIRVSANMSTGELSVYNDGRGIDVAEHPKTKLYVPEMIFGVLLTSSNYKKDEKRFTGGKNGYGAKLTNIFAKEFTVETVDAVRGLKYKQTWKDNKKVIGKPKITATKVKPYTKITWTPDYARFGLTGLTDGMMKVIRRRTYDCAAWCGASVKVRWNDEVIPCKNFLHYSKLLAGDKPVVMLKGNKHWDVSVFASDEGYKHISFVNGIFTAAGGTHVKHVTKQLTDALVVAIKKKMKKTIRPIVIRDCLSIVIRSMIVNPSFVSQSKETLATPVSKMGTKWELDPKDVNAILTKTGILDRLMEAHGAEEDKEAKKSDGKKKSRITGLPKLEDATKAGTRESHKCTLILTEGDSAATTAISGLKVVGRDYYGVFPLKGKVINAKNVSSKKVNENDEIQNLKKIIGLVSGKKYTDVNSLRYGRVMVMTDQDHDGSHIKGLVMNMFHSQWPELLKMGYVVSMLTPIVKAFKKGKEEQAFYTLYDYEQWREREESKGWEVMYYKGLGTSTAKEARAYFETLRGIHYDWSEASATELDKAFLKGQEEARKKWISDYDPSDILKFSDSGKNTFTHVSIPDFVNKELIAYSHASTIRAIPNLMDGLKTSQRKILFGCFKKNLKKQIRVAQLAGAVSELSAYHHGEASLNQTIVGMAQTYVGSNNINLLQPLGQFGTRLQGGKDSASPRYIHTLLSNIASKIFRSEDLPVLTYLDDDGIPVEPDWYAPIIPMLLVNGSEGIATGYSTKIPAYNPTNIVAAIRSRLNGDTTPLSVGSPWWRGFTGTIVEDSSGRSFKMYGSYKIKDENTIEITELPIGKWTKDYREFLEKSLNGSPMCKTPLFADIQDDYNDIDVKFTIEFMPGVLASLIKKGEFEKKMGLETSIHLTNMWMYDSNNRLRKFDTPEDILDDYIGARLRVYDKRKEYILSELEKELAFVNAKAEFIRLVTEDEINLRDTDKNLAIALLINNLPELSEKSSRDLLSGWKYLMDMPVRSLTIARREKLLKERDTLMEKIENLKKETPRSLWLSDLKEFDEAYAEFLKERANADEDTRKDDKKVVSKTTTIVRRRRRKAPASKA